MALKHKQQIILFAVFCLTTDIRRNNNMNIETKILEIFNKYDPLDSYDGLYNHYKKDVDVFLDHLNDIDLNQKGLSRYFKKQYKYYNHNYDFINSLLDVI